MVLTSHPFSLSVSPSNFFCRKRHFYDMELHGITLFRGNFSLSTTLLWTIFSLSNTLLWTIFWRSTTLLWTNLFEPENAQTRRKHEKKTKKTRKKHAILRTFRLTKEKISGLNWTTEKQRVKMTLWNQRLKKSLWSGWKPTTPPRAKMARGLNFIAGCDEVALKSATS